MRRLAASTIAGSFALSAFAVAVVAGMASDNPASVVLFRSIIAMLLCYPAGLLVGIIAQRVVQEQIEVHRASHPSPDSTIDEVEEPTRSQKSEDDGEVLVV